MPREVEDERMRRALTARYGRCMQHSVRCLSPNSEKRPAPVCPPALNAIGTFSRLSNESYRSSLDRLNPRTWARWGKRRVVAYDRDHSYSYPGRSI